MLEIAIIWVGNGITTAVIVVFNDRFFKKHIEKLFDKVEKGIKDSIKVTKKE